MNVTFRLGSGELGVMTGPDGTPIQSVRPSEVKIDGFKLTEVVDTEHGGAYAGWLLSGGGRVFEIIVAHSPVGPGHPLPDLGEVIPILFDLARSRSD
jgi:hypothetical protein